MRLDIRASSDLGELDADGGRGRALGADEPADVGVVGGHRGQGAGGRGVDLVADVGGGRGGHGEVVDALGPHRRVARDVAALATAGGADTEQALVTDQDEV